MPAPTATEVADFVNADGSSYDETTVVAPALATERAAQARVCNVPAEEEEWPSDLAEALCRRVARNIALAHLPIGSEAYEAAQREIRRLEAPFRKRPVG